MTKTFKELQEVDMCVAQLYAKDETLRKSKMGYAYTRFHDKYYAPVSKEFVDALNIVRVNNALEDEKTKEVIQDASNPRGFKFSKEGLKKCMADEASLVLVYQAKEIECEPYVSSYIPSDLTEEQISLLTGIIM